MSRSDQTKAQDRDRHRDRDKDRHRDRGKKGKSEEAWTSRRE